MLLAHGIISTILPFGEGMVFSIVGTG